MQACMHAWKAFSCPSTMLWKATCCCCCLVSRVIGRVVLLSRRGALGPFLHCRCSATVSSMIQYCWLCVLKAGFLMGRLTVSPRWTKALKQRWSGILSCRFHHCHRAIIWCIYQLYRFYDSKHCLVWCNQKSNVYAYQTSISTSTNHKKTPTCEHVRTRKVLQFLDSHRVLLPPSPFAVLSDPCLNLKWTHILINRLRW